MNGIGLIWNKCGELVEQSEWKGFQAKMGHRCSGLPYQSPLVFRSKSGMLWGNQPKTYELRVTSKSRISFHGCLYNRVALSRALRNLTNSVLDINDDELVLLAYLQWGRECVKKLEGEFAFALWDDRNNEIFCARDFMGLKPFYYCHSRNMFACASEPAPLTTLSQLSHEPNDAALAALLSNQLRSSTDTLFSSIQRLPAAHYLIVNKYGFSQSRYYHYDFDKKIRYKSDDLYGEHFNELIEQALIVRDEVHPTFGSTLSGGIDSSTITGKIKQMHTAGKLSKCAAGVYSMIFPGLSCDESMYISDVGKLWDLEIATVDPTQYSYGSYFQQVSRFKDSPWYPHRAMVAPMLSKAKSDGVDVLVSGFGSDELFSGSPYYISDCIKGFKFSEIFSKRVKYGVAEADLIRGHFLKFGLFPLLPEVMKIKLRALRTRYRKDCHYPSWLGPRAIAQLEINSELESRRFQPSSFYREQSQATIHQTLESPWLQQVIEQSERISAVFGVSETHPFLDKAIVEFALAIPESMRWTGDQTKHVIRKSMKNIIPETIMYRTEKTEFVEIQYKAIGRMCEEMPIEDLKAYESGWLERDEFLHLIRETKNSYENGDPAYADNVWPIWCAFSLELVLNISD